MFKMPEKFRVHLDGYPPGDETCGAFIVTLKHSIFRDFMPEIEEFSRLPLDEENERLALLPEEMGI